MLKIDEIYERYAGKSLYYDQDQTLRMNKEQFIKAADEIGCFVKNQCNQNYLDNRLQRDGDIQLAILNKGVSYLGLPRNIRDEDA